MIGVVDRLRTLSKESQMKINCAVMIGPKFIDVGADREITQNTEDISKEVGEMFCTFMKTFGHVSEPFQATLDAQTISNAVAPNAEEDKQPDLLTPVVVSDVNQTSVPGETAKIPDAIARTDRQKKLKRSVEAKNLQVKKQA